MQKPDIVASIGKTSLIIDTQVVSEQADLERADKLKRDKYGTNKNLIAKIKSKYETDTVVSMALTITWRGIWARTSADRLRRRGLLTTEVIKIVSSRAIIGSIIAWNVFNRATSTAWERRKRRGG